jgi:pyruvate ferredoxin oxidoreductase gamma subunit/2-oxoisovalerate ferredoxin oxidoreductase gamma subunit
MKDDIHDIRFHGRGGQGVVTGSRLLAEAALLENKFVHAFPAFGPERAGAPIAAFTRLSDKKFTIKTEIYKPNMVICQDPSLLKQISILTGIEDEGIVIINHNNKEELMKDLNPQKNITVAMIDATTIAQRYLGRPIANTAMVGALIKLSGIVDIENTMIAVRKLFPGNLGEKNAQAILDAYLNVEIIQGAIKGEVKKIEPTLEEKAAEITVETDDPMSIVKQWTTEKWGYEKLPMGTVVPIPGSSKAFKTGDWAAVQPTLVKEKCLHCLTCYFVCPDTAIYMDYSENPKGYPVIKTEFCKGCGMCAFECDERALLFPGIAETPLDSTDVREETHCDENEGGN